MLRLGLCIDPHAFAAAGIVPKVLRSLDPNLARSPRDRRARESKRRQLLDEALEGSNIDPTTTYPGLGERWGRSPADQHAIKLPRKSIDRLFEKIVRGLTYVETGRFIEATHTVGIYPLDPGDASPFTKVLDLHGRVHARGPGIVVRKAVAQDDGLSAIYEVDIWGVFRAYAAVTPAEP